MTVKLGSGIGPHFRPNPGNVCGVQKASHPLRTVYCVRSLQSCICSYRCNSSTRIIRCALGGLGSGDSSIRFTESSLAVEVIAPFVHLHGLFPPPFCIELSRIIGHYVYCTEYVCMIQEKAVPGEPHQEKSGRTSRHPRWRETEAIIFGVSSKSNFYSGQ